MNPKSNVAKEIEVATTEENSMVTPKTWDEFRATGLFMLMNSFLHIFGWSIVINVQYSDELEEDVVTVYPARVKFRGFSEASATKAYQKVSKYMVDNAEELYKESNM